MAILILVMLLIVWAVVLGPGLWRRRSASHSTDSIYAFHRALRVLQRTGDPTMLPPRRVGAAGLSVLRADGRPALLLVRPDSSPPRTGPGGPGRRDAELSAAFFSADACKRRRDIFFGLVASVVGTGVLGAMPPLRPLLVVMVMAAMALAGYVALLVRLRTVASERRARARALAARRSAASPPVSAPTPMFDSGEPTQQLVQRRAAAR